jgi:hypothetical protein
MSKEKKQEMVEYDDRIAEKLLMRVIAAEKEGDHEAAHNWSAAAINIFSLFTNARVMSGYFDAQEVHLAAVEAARHRDQPKEVVLPLGEVPIPPNPHL